MSAATTMAPGLSANDRERLIRILGMLGSAYPGERDAAATAATRFLTARGCTWEEVLRPDVGHPPPPPPEAPPRPRHEPESWYADAAYCLDYLDLISRDELWFCLKLVRGDDPMTPAKYERLKGIVDRLYADPRRARP